MNKDTILQLHFRIVPDGVSIWGLGEGKIQVAPENLPAFLENSANGECWPYEISMMRGAGGRPVYDLHDNVWCEVRLKSDLRWQD